MADYRWNYVLIYKSVYKSISILFSPGVHESIESSFQTPPENKCIEPHSLSRRHRNRIHVTSHSLITLSSLSTTLHLPGLFSISKYRIIWTSEKCRTSFPFERINKLQYRVIINGANQMERRLSEEYTRLYTWTRTPSIFIFRNVCSVARKEQQRSLIIELPLKCSPINSHFDKCRHFGGSAKWITNTQLVSDTPPYT